jgi:hypothetical protein
MAWDFSVRFDSIILFRPNRLLASIKGFCIVWGAGIGVMSGRNFGLVVLVAASLVFSAFAAEKKDPPVPCASVASIGVAHMSRDGVITLRIRSLPSDRIAEGELRYAPGSPHYDEIMQHLGGIAPGESKPVRPWC